MANQVSLKKIAAALVVAGMAAGTAQAATLTGATTDAIVIAPMTISETTPLNFGSVLGEAATVTLDYLDTVTPAANSFGGATTGVLAVTGDGNRAYTVTVSNVSTLTGPGPAMTATINTDKDAGGTLSAAGTDTILVGGTLTIAAGQTPGAYSGTYDVTVNY